MIRRFLVAIFATVGFFFLLTIAGGVAAWWLLAPEDADVTDGTVVTLDLNERFSESRDGDPYWDGGYMGNPAIYPLIYRCDSQDVAIIQINPIEREGVPRTPAEIVNRLNEITFNSSLMREMRAIAFVTKLIEDKATHGPQIGRLKRMFIHMIDPGETMKSLGVSSKMNPEMEFLLALKGFGRARTEAWLAASFDDLGHRSSVDLAKVFL